LFRSIGPNFGPSEEADQSVRFSYDGERTLRIVWKIVCGLYALMMGRALPLATRRFCYPLVGPWRAAEELQKIEWLPLLQGDSLGQYGSVFDYRWISFIDHDRGPLRAHGLALLLWDRVIAPVLIHDPACACSQCRSGADPRSSRGP
jgi:hypothetical protein